MSYDPRRAPRPYRPSDEDENVERKGGSVRAARERLQMQQRQQQLPDRSRIIGLPQRPNQLVSQYSTDGQQYLQPSQNNAPRGRNNAPSPQWPLSNDQEDVLDSRPGQYPRSPNRGAPPQRPPRPTSDELPIQPTSPSDYRGSYQSDDVFSPNSLTTSSRPLTTSSAASESSSLGDIPDFPIPQPPMPAVQSMARRQPMLGPPPSSRRGPSSYYTQMSYVSPIAEESEARSDTIRSHHGSFASSNVIPSNNKDFYVEEDDMISDDDSETVTSDYGRDSRASDHDEKSDLVGQPALLRQASLGRRTKPSLMTIKSVDSFGEKKAGPVKRKPIPDPVFGGAGAAGIGGAMMAARDGIDGGGSTASLSNGTGLLDPSSSSSESVTTMRNITSSGTGAESQRALNGGMDSPTLAMPPATKQASFADRIGKRRPPRIDVDAVREAEARGSLTSLPELIRRATRLAANLDRGKTASRLGLDFWEAGAEEKGRYDSRRSGSLSDMLAAFPPPGEATPTGDRTPNPKRTSKWPASAGGGYGDQSRQSDRSSERRRRCCGMPMWTFITLLIVLLFLIAAAVVIPVVLIVLPRMNNTNNGAASQATSGQDNNPPPAATQTSSSSSNAQCSGVITCQNGGVAILNSDKSCNCVCINGFTGKTCNTEGDAGCTTANIAGAADNATIGSGIPRLLDVAQSNFSVPLNGTQLLSLFSNLSMSCNTENALITFNGLASKRSVPRVEGSIEPSKSLPLLDLAQRDQGLRPLDARQAIGNFGSEKGAASGTATAEATATATPSTPISSNSTAIDFARVSVLLALQESHTLSTAADAQESIQDFLTENRQGESNGNTVDLGTFTIDLVALTIKFDNGTTIQA